MHFFQATTVLQMRVILQGLWKKLGCDLSMIQLYSTRFSINTGLNFWLSSVSVSNWSDLCCKFFDSSFICFKCNSEHFECAPTMLFKLRLEPVWFLSNLLFWVLDFRLKYLIFFSFARLFIFPDSNWRFEWLWNTVLI